jgi:hypothetical protein
MREPENLLRTLPPETPPPEVVTAAMRVFRYRALAAVALACALVLSAIILKAKVDADARLLERIGAIRYTTGGVDHVADVRDLDGLKVVLWEVVVDEAPTSYVHVLAWDERGRDFTLAISNPEVDGATTSLAAIEGSGGGRRPTYTDLWQEIRLPASANDVKSLSFDVEVDGAAISGSIPFQVAI